MAVFQFAAARSRRAPKIVLAGSVAAVALTAGSARGALLFDDISAAESGVTGASITATSSTPNTYLGDGYVLATGAKDITGFDLFPYNNTGTNYTGLSLTVYVWGTINTGTVSATAPAFSNLLGTYTATSTGTFNTGSYYSFQTGSPGATPAITLGTPLQLTSNTVGLTFAYQGTTDGVTFANANNLTSIISYGVAPTVGSEVFNGYYRNANSETNGNFTSATRTLGVTFQSAAVRVYGDVSAVPEPASAGLLAAAGVGVLARRRRRA